MAALPPISNNPVVATGPASSPASSPIGKVGKSDSNAFEQLMTQAVDDQKASDTAVSDLVSGKNDNVQQVVMQVVKSEMSFQLFMEVRNQLIESYNELMRMQF